MFDQQQILKSWGRRSLGWEKGRGQDMCLEGLIGEDHYIQG